MMAKKKKKPRQVVADQPVDDATQQVSQAKPEPDSPPEQERETVPESAIASEADAATESDPQPDLETKAEPELVSVPESPPESTPELTPESQSEAESPPEPEPASESEPEPQSELEQQPSPESESSQDTSSELVPEPKSEPEPEAKPHESIPPEPESSVVGKTGRQRLMESFHQPRLSAGQLLGAFLCGLLGFALVVQAKATSQAGLIPRSESEIVRSLEETSQRNIRLEAEAKELQRTLDDLNRNSGSALNEQARRQAQEIAILAGTTPVQGPGITLTITGPIKADHLLDAVQELRGAGAEAISIGPVRVVAQTAFVDTPEGIEIDAAAVHSPYKVIAIGNVRDLQTGLEMPGGVKETLQGVTDVQVAIAPSNSLRIDAIHQPDQQRYAHPAVP